MEIFIYFLNNIVSYSNADSAFTLVTFGILPSELKLQLKNRKKLRFREVFYTADISSNVHVYLFARLVPRT